MLQEPLQTGFNPTITPQQLYSADNIQQAATAPVAPPNYSDPYALRDYFMNSPDIVASRNSLSEANRALMEIRNSGRTQQQAIKELPMAMNVIRGSQAVAGEQASLREQAAAESLLASQSTYDTLAREASARYSIAQEERGKLQEIITQTGGKAGITYADNFEEALKKATDYQTKIQKKEKKEAEEMAKKEEKEKLRDLASSFGISTKGLSRGELRRLLEKKAKKDQDLKDKMDSLSIQAKKLDMENTRSLIAERGVPSAAEAEAAIFEEGRKGVENFFESVKGAKDGFVNPSDYVRARAQWAKNKLDVKDFDAMFGYYINPFESSSGKGKLQTSGVTLPKEE